MLSQETIIKEEQLISKLFDLAWKYHLSFDYLSYKRMIKFGFNHHVYFKILYSVINEKSVDEIYNCIYYSLHHNYRLIKEE